VLLCALCFFFLRVDDGDLDVDARLEVDGGQLGDGLLRGVEVDEALVDVHLVAVPRVGTVAARALAGDVVQGARGEADGAADLDAAVLVVLGRLLGARHKIGGHLLDGSSVAGPKGDANLVVLRLAALLHDVSHVWWMIFCW
jgi:hypothetical protein